MDGNSYFQQELENGNIPKNLIAMAEIQLAGDDEQVFDLLKQMIVKAFEDGKNDEVDVQFKAGNMLHR